MFGIYHTIAATMNQSSRPKAFTMLSRTKIRSNVAVSAMLIMTTKMTKYSGPRLSSAMIFLMLFSDEGGFVRTQLQLSPEQPARILYLKRRRLRAWVKRAQITTDSLFETFNKRKNNDRKRNGGLKLRINNVWRACAHITTLNMARPGVSHGSQTILWGWLAKHQRQTGR